LIVRPGTETMAAARAKRANLIKRLLQDGQASCT